MPIYSPFGVLPLKQKKATPIKSSVCFNERINQFYYLWGAESGTEFVHLQSTATDIKFYFKGFTKSEIQRKARKYQHQSEIYIMDIVQQRTTHTFVYFNGLP